MRPFLFAFLLILSGFSGALPALAQDDRLGKQDSEVHADAVTPLSEESLDGLFARLAASKDEPEARAAEYEILKRFHASGSDTTDLLMSWVSRAMNEENYPLALDLLDQIVVLQPDFAEGWNKRATVHYLRGDHGKSISDIEKTLALEPRHFGALSGLGIILREIGEANRALLAFEEALKLHPYLGNAKDMVKRIRDESGDRDI